jgi:hypothetical protein
MATDTPLHHTLPLAVGVVLTALGVAGLLRDGRQGWGGYIYNPQRIIDWVEPRSAAAAAGLRQGDSVITVDATPAQDLPMQSRWATTRPGETHRLVVMREGLPVAADVVYRPRGPNPFAQGALVVLLAYLWCGLWAGLTVPTAPARALASVGLAAGVGGAAAPNIGGIWNGVVSHVQMAALVLMTVFLLRLFLVFPKPKRVSGSRVVAVATYVVVAFLVAFQVLEMIVHPRLYLVTGNVGGLVMLACFVLTLAALTHTVVTTPRGEVWKSGLGWALIGVAAAVVAIVVPVVGTALRLEGLAWLELLLAALPLALALAVRKQARWQGGGS